MACFLLPMAEGALTTAVSLVLKNHSSSGTTTKVLAKVGHLNKILWCSSIALFIDHIASGEIVPTFPFFTAIRTGGMAAFWDEVTMKGTLVALGITAVWAIYEVASFFLQKQAAANQAA